MSQRQRSVVQAGLLIALLLVAPVCGAQTVTLWTQWATSDYLIEILNEFTGETGIQVDLRAIGWGTDELVVAIAGDAPPDLFTHGEAALGYFADLGFMEPLTNYVARWPFAADIADPVLKALEYNGELMALPFQGVAVRDLVYRADFFEQAGLGSDEPPVHWDDFVAYGQKLTQFTSDGAMLRAAINRPDRQMFYMFFYQSGGTLFEDGQPQLDSEAADTALRFMVDLIHRYRLDDLDFTGGDVLVGTRAMQWSDARLFTRAPEDVAPVLRVATFPYSQQPSTFGAVDFIALSPAARNKEAALKLLEYLLHPARQERLSREAGQVPIYRQAVDWEWIRSASYMPHFINAINYIYRTNIPSHFFEVRDAVTEAVDKAIRLADDPRNALIDANEKIKAILAQGR